MRWQPAHEAHAIERVSLTFQFADAVAAKPLQALLNVAGVELPKQGFNAVVDDHELNLTQVMAAPGLQSPGAGVPVLVGPGGLIAPGQPVQAAVVGRSFQAVNGGGQVREEVQLHRNRFTHATLIYDGWNAYRARVVALLGSYLDRALAVVDLQSIKLEYWDRFVFDGPIPEVAYDELLRRGSRHLPGFSFDTAELWHSHVGYFAPPPSPRRLVNVNVDVVDLVQTPPPGQAPRPLDQKRSVGIYTMVQDTVAAAALPSDHEGVLSTLEDLHTTLKEALGDVITREASDRISLNAQVPS